VLYIFCAKFIYLKYLFPSSHQALADSQYDWMTSILSSRSVITLPFQHHFLKVFESWALRSGVQCLDHFEPRMCGHNVASVHPMTRRHIVVDRNHLESSVVPIYLFRWIKTAGAWSRPLIFVSLPYSGTLPSLLFFIVGLLHVWKKPPRIALGQLNPNVFTGRFETFSCYSC
jgi:hypothetical protein